MEPSDKLVTYVELPSLTYIKVLVKGAAESNLSKEYVNFLRGIKQNGKLHEGKEKELQLECFHL